MADYPEDHQRTGEPANVSFFDGVLPAELRLIRERRARALANPPVESGKVAPASALEDAHITSPFGVSFSGGGIRSATFNLGVVQGLAEKGLLRHVDYLSTVSGGGYIGGWLHGLIRNQHRGSPAQAEQVLSPAQRPVPGPPDEDPVTFLRKYSNYLAPRSGALQRRHLGHRIHLASKCPAQPVDSRAGDCRAGDGRVAGRLPRAVAPRPT